MNNAPGVRRLKVGTLKIEVHPNRKAAGQAAARAVAEEVSRLEENGVGIGIIFAAAASQLDTLNALIEREHLPWNRIQGFHLDEYVGITAEHPASFRRFLRDNLTSHVQMKEFYELNGNANSMEQVCRDYAKKLHDAKPQLGLLGIGENGHLAFNDPPEANFTDPVDVKVAHLDNMCREQQVAEGWFKTLKEVPETALTLTIPTVLRVPKLIASVPGSRKAAIIRRTLEEPISTNCPSTILRTHPDATIYLDTESAAELQTMES